MDNWLEFIVPVIFAAIYFFGNMFSKSDESEDAPRPRRPLTPVEDPEAVERQRRIQEEIRRKIMARREAAEREAGGGAVERSREPVREERWQRVPEPEPEVVAEVPVTKIPVEATAVEQSEAKAFSWDNSDNAYEHGIEARLKAIEQTKARAAKLKRQADQATRRVDYSNARRRGAGSGSGRLSGPIREVLKDPAAARAAFIYGEVLGQPSSLKQSSSVPGLR